MAPATIAEIHQAVAAYRAGTIDVEHLSAWIDESTWTLDPSADPDAYELSRSVMLILEEYALGEIEEPAVHRAIEDMPPVGWRAS